MISQRCPRCGSQRVRRGYRPTPLWSKLLFRYRLLCDKCNWEFVGFAVPGTVSSKPKRRKSDEPKSIKISDIADDLIEMAETKIDELAGKTSNAQITKAKSDEEISNVAFAKDETGANDFDIKSAETDEDKSTERRKTGRRTASGM